MRPGAREEAASSLAAVTAVNAAASPREEVGGASRGRYGHQSGDSKRVRRTRSHGRGRVHDRKRGRRQKRKVQEVGDDADKRALGGSE